MLRGLTQEDFDRERNKMIAVVRGTAIPKNFALGELAKADDLIREADHLLAEAVRENRDLCTKKACWKNLKDMPMRSLICWPSMMRRRPSNRPCSRCT